MKRQPLKRHAALVPLSRQHHKALVLAQVLKVDVPAYRGLPTSREGKIIYAQEAYRTWLQSHFEWEEEVLLPATETRTPELAKLGAQVRREHAELRAAFEALSAETSEAVLDELGKALAAHVRFEERTWFMAVQGVLSGEELDGLTA